MIVHDQEEYPDTIVKQLAIYSLSKYIYFDDSVRDTRRGLFKLLPKFWSQPRSRLPPGSRKDDWRNTMNAEENPIHGVPIRSINRAFQILKIINRHHSPSIMEIKDESGLPYPTVYRIVMTLVHEGLIECEPSRKRYRPTELVWSLVTGFQQQDLLVARARDHLVDLTKKVLWPISMSVRVGNRMMVKDSTHSLTTQTFTNYYPGYTLPLFDCAAGKAYLAFCPKEEHKIILDAASASEEKDLRWAMQISGNEDFLETIRQQGFAFHARVLHNETPGKTSALSVPIYIDGSVRACLTLVYFEKAMSMAAAIEKYVKRLQKTAALIGAGAPQDVAEAHDLPV